MTGRQLDRQGERNQVHDCSWQEGHMVQIIADPRHL